eukprot:1783918-Heterocapsa_arctica.AAC.1
MTDARHRRSGRGQRGPWTNIRWIGGGLRTPRAHAVERARVHLHAEAFGLERVQRDGPPAPGGSVVVVGGGAGPTERVGWVGLGGDRVDPDVPVEVGACEPELGDGAGDERVRRVALGGRVDRPLVVVEDDD